MKKLLKKFEAAMMAVAFAEEGEFETAVSLAKGNDEANCRKPDARDYERPAERKIILAE